MRRRRARARQATSGARRRASFRTEPRSLHAAESSTNNGTGSWRAWLPPYPYDFLITFCWGPFDLEGELRVGVNSRARLAMAPVFGIRTASTHAGPLDSHAVPRRRQDPQAPVHFGVGQRAR